jgi:HEAT repeat protein
LNDPENSVRIAAVKALGPIQSDQSLEKIFKVLKKRPNFMLHNAAVESLRFYKNQLDKIETVAQRGSFYERLSAVKTLSHFAGKHQIDILIDIVNNDISSWIKAEAISGLG